MKLSTDSIESHLQIIRIRKIKTKASNNPNKPPKNLLMTLNALTLSTSAVPIFPSNHAKIFAPTKRAIKLIASAIQPAIFSLFIALINAPVSPNH